LRTIRRLPKIQTESKWQPKQQEHLRKVKEAKPEENGSSAFVETEQGENGIAEEPEKSDGDGDNGARGSSAQNRSIFKALRRSI
jgi:hypothetical protein